MNISRRSTLFVASATTACSLIPGKVLGANGKVNVAWIGVGGRGNRIITNFEKSGIANFIAFCDVQQDTKYLQEAQTRFPNAKIFQDWRVMLDQIGNEIDAVVVLTPDHNHFPITISAMAMGKHVYTEKPLARTFQEIELLMAAEQKYKVVTQMGNQGHTSDNFNQFKAWQEAGIIKDVTHVDAYMNKWRRWHPWGDVPGYPTGEPMRAHLDWDIWKGVTPLDVEYSDKLHPGNWRGWHQYGTGCFGDWGAHILDTIHEFLELGLPSTITAKKRELPNPYVFPLASTINFGFPERNGMPAMDIDWYDGAENLPPLPPEFAGKTLNKDKPGKFIYSKDYVFQGDSHGSLLQILPYEKMRELLVAGKLPKNFGKNPDHYESFLRACRGENTTNSRFSVSGPLSQMLALGCMAQRLGGSLEFDRETKQITNNKLANSLLKDNIRKGWEQYYKL
ncbi:Gfo/Idh/MocA family protein [Pontiella sulfatireligans]|uniref:Scyllo-inositol 2-dehydrogenase (NADP(+)) n=1 Tax=Pontiella sulfatireligans TaxID=2750658 RepID=A0A6C2UQ63_9BACT|nr:Gfo/Idh/MocA family oxidoreductase [Pontiella sulfatireligans]VGO22430.1 scyllo-inositol 2-dehydrogenase (NADP(+)) [Pontiella sulfatireligans]